MAKNSPVVNTFDFDDLIKLTVKNAGFLADYFRLHFIYYELISGKGLEFDKIKEYVMGDDTKRIDWKIYARSNKLFVRTYKEERELDIVIVLDVSNSMLLGTQEFTKNEYGAVLAGLLAFAATEAGDNVGGGTFCDEKSELIEAEGEYIHLMNALSKKENYGGKKNWEKLTNELLMNYDDNAIIFIISDFIETNVDEFLPELTTKFSKIFGVMIKDPIDYDLPGKSGKIFLKDPQTQKVVFTDLKSVKEEYGVLSRHEIEKIKDTFHQYGQLCFTISTGEDFTKTFIKAMGDEQVEIS